MRQYFDRFRFSLVQSFEVNRVCLLQWKQSFVMFWVDQCQKFKKVKGSYVTCHSLKGAAEICNSDSILQNKIENFWEIERFGSKTDSSTVYKSFCEDICYKSNETIYEIRLPFKDDYEILPDNFTHCKHIASWTLR